MILGQSRSGDGEFLVVKKAACLARRGHGPAFKARGLCAKIAPELELYARIEQLAAGMTLTVVIPAWSGSRPMKNTRPHCRS